jgi:NitT/TauT family transport system permease protein
MRRHAWLRDLQALAMLGLAWEILARLLASPALPPASAVIPRLAGLLGGELWPHALSSLARVLAGLLIGLAFGLPAGIAIGLRQRLDRLAAPVVWLLYPVPKIALLPVFFLLFGLGEGAKIALIGVIVVFPLIIAGRDGVRSIPEELCLSARSLDLGRRHWYRHLILPAIAPQVFSALRIAAGIAFSVLFFAENFATDMGLGCFIMNSWAIMRYADLYAGVVSLGLLGLILFRLLESLESRLCRWQRPATRDRA